MDAMRTEHDTRSGRTRDRLGGAASPRLCDREKAQEECERIRAMESHAGRSYLAAATVLAIGLVAGAFVLGTQLKQIRSGRQTITVKGLAEKSIRADRAEWTVGIKVYAPTFAETLTKMRSERPPLDRFLEQQGFD